MLTFGTINQYSAHPTQSLCQPLWNFTVFFIFLVIWIIDCIVNDRCTTHISLIAHGPTSEAWSFDISSYEDDGYTCGPSSWHSCSADNSWASLCMDLPILPETDRSEAHRAAAWRYLTFTLLMCVCVSAGQWHPLRMIHIHSVHLCHAGNSSRYMLDHWDSLCA